MGAKNRHTHTQQLGGGGKVGGANALAEKAELPMSACVAHRSVADISSPTLFIPYSSSYRFPSLFLFPVQQQQQNRFVP